MQTPAPFRFDGHGINDAEGQRITKVQSVQPYDGQERNAEFDALSNLFAAAPELLKALNNLLEDVEYAQPLIKPGLIGNIQIRKAREAIAKATGG